MDIVNYILKQFLICNLYHGAPIHYLMIDEVQDLNNATLLLLIKLAE